MKLLITAVLMVFTFLSSFSQEYKVSQPPAEPGLDNFYKKYLDAAGIPVVSSWRVPDEALIKVAQMTGFFLENLPAEVADNLRKYNFDLYEIIAGYFPEVEFSLSCHCKK